MESRPVHVGILAMEVYVPANMVHVEDLEAVDGCVGKYTKGLEQVALSFATECEDVVSIALTCMHSLLDKHNVDPRRLGRLEVGSESNPDRCKSIKSHLMRLVGSAGNHDIEGVDSVHGCYGATAALFNAINWVESSSWDGRYAVVVAADVSSYAPGSASRATGGAGAVAMLIGPNAPLVADPAWRASYCDNSNEFCKPADAGPVPTFNGNATIQQFLKAVDCTYIYLFRRLQRLHARMLDMGALATPFDVSQGILPLVHHYLSHSPYARLVRKAFARLALQDAVRTPQGDGMLAAAGVPARWRVCAPDALPGAGYEDKALETAMLNATSNSYNIKVLPGASTQKQVGNAYTASLYLGLAGLWEAQGAQLQGRRLLLFSFGSGTMATLFALVGRAVGGDAGAFTLQGVADKMRLGAMLRERTRTSPASYDAVLQQMQQQWGRVPRSLSTELATTSCHQRIWLLTHVDEHHVRTYDRHGGTPRGRQQQSPQSQQTQMTWP